MKQIRHSLTIIGAAVLLALAAGCATTATTSTTDMLTAAGFKLVTADTPKKQELLKSLPTGQLTLIT